MEQVLRSLVLVFLLAGGVLHLFQRMRMPSIVGLLLAGVLIGPHGLGVLEDRQLIENLAEIGILLMMFTIGLDFTRERLQELLYAAGIGSVQMLICIVVSTVACINLVDRWVEAVFIGFLLAHTSSTLMLKLFLDRGELSTPPVRLGIGISITQDLSVVLMLLAVPLMQSGQLRWSVIGSTLLSAVAVLSVAALLSRWFIPLWMKHVVRSRSRELFLIFLIVICLGTAWSTLVAGLSIGLGAFLAGLAIAESGYSHHTLSEVAPFRDFLISLFFLSTGMLLDVSLLGNSLGLALLLLLAVIVFKFISGFLPVLLWGYPLRVATIVGVAIAQIGEFSFVLGYTGLGAGLISPEIYSVFLLVAVGSMIASPFLVSYGKNLVVALTHVPALRRLDRHRMLTDTLEHSGWKNHLIIAGYGLNGRNVANALQRCELPFVVMDMNPDAVHAAQRRGEPVYFGDCSRLEMLRKLHIDQARGLVLAISDPKATRQAVQVARHENPELHIIVRTRYVNEIDILRQLGANQVVAEEFETSLEVLGLALHAFETPPTSISRIIESFRANSYHGLRDSRSLTPQAHVQLLDNQSPELKLESWVLEENAAPIGKTVGQLALHSHSGAVLLAIARNSQLITPPGEHLQLLQHDRLLLAGSPQQLSDAVQLLSQPSDNSN